MGVQEKALRNAPIGDRAFWISLKSLLEDLLGRLVPE